MIVGGGLSGLLAAKKLAGTDKDVLLIEKENELGGILNNSSASLTFFAIAEIAVVSFFRRMILAEGS